MALRYGALYRRPACQTSGAPLIQSRPLLSVLLLTALSAAPASAAATLPKGASSSASSGSLELALDAVDTERISADIHFLASDEMAGRDTPSPGQRIAARYIEARLKHLGFEPGAGEDFLYEFPLQQVKLGTQDSFVEVTNVSGAQRFEFAQDYFFQHRGLQDGDAAGKVVFAGYGEASDLEGLELKGRWVFTWDRLPPQAMRGRNRAAEKAGALGIIVTPGDEYADKPYGERFSNWVRRLTNGRVSWPEPLDEPGDFFPTIFVSRDVAQALLGDRTPRKGDVLPGSLREQRRIDDDALFTDCENVCGFWPGAHPELKKEVILLSAHYDHVGVGADGEIYNGADDNGSGTTGLLALADALHAYGPMERSVMLIWVSGEEKGLLGSRAWATNPSLPEGYSAFCNINLDMIGRNEPDKLLITPTSRRKEYNGLVRLAERHAPQEGFPTLGSCDAYWHRSDQAMFARYLDIPVTFMFTDVHEDYHKETDTPDKVDYDKIRRVTRLVMRMLDGLQQPGLDLDSPSFPGD